MRVSGLYGITPYAPAVRLRVGTACDACTRDVTVMSVKACWISNAYSGIAARLSMASGACPYQLLGLNLPTDDWWELLQMEPEA